jgi:hypothetical protein
MRGVEGVERVAGAGTRDGHCFDDERLVEEFESDEPEGTRGMWVEGAKGGVVGLRRMEV